MMENSITQIYWQKLLLWLPQLLSAMLILLLFGLLALILKKLCLRFSRKAKLKQTNTQLTLKIVQGMVYTVGIISALGSAGVNISALVTGLGIGGFAVGYAMKDIVSNLLAGLLILVYRPFKIGSQVEVAGVTGKVTQVNMRYTAITNGKGHTLIPNAKLLTNIVKVVNV